MEQRETYQTVMYPELDTFPGWGRILDERETERHANVDLEMVLTYVPEAGEMLFSDALRLAHERDAEAADTLRLSCIQTASI